MERLPRLIKPSDRYPFLLLHMGTNDTAKKDLELITADYVALGRRIKEFEAHVVFSSILPVEGKGPGRDCRIMEVNEWVCLRSGCCLSNCTIKPGAACISGLCCKNCQFHRQGKICRESIGECDLPEYCNGTSDWCPEDVFKQDGTPCGDNDCCFQGRCRNHERQCKAVFGKVQTPVDDILCWGTEFNSGRDTVDVGSVGDGTACGDNKICINRTCVNITILDYDCNYTKCSNRGMCNSKKNCHCNFGWAPPDCTLKGFGGSVDSGPPPTTSTVSHAFVTSSPYYSNVVSWSCP
ncbi:disintegrin and metalloproteinase domain-containing protein 21-like [Emys orbicularis]|uniref:disintegrin and metalloproteinase domain-containing protein 21-like n=1 Tax=Emys orbicularis TaxID=82168 RepID=UPI0031FC3D4B